MIIAQQDDNEWTVAIGNSYLSNQERLTELMLISLSIYKETLLKLKWFDICNNK